MNWLSHLWPFLGGLLVAALVAFGFRSKAQSLTEQAAEKAKADRRRARLEAHVDVARTVTEAGEDLARSENLALAEVERDVASSDLAKYLERRRRRTD